jgi:hypothetical protein
MKTAMCKTEIHEDIGIGRKSDGLPHQRQAPSRHDMDFVQ